MRLEALNAFTLLLKGAGKAASEPTLKELHKFLKTALPDKAQVIRVAAAQVSQILNDQFVQTVTHLLTGFCSILYLVFTSMRTTCITKLYIERH